MIKLTFPIVKPILSQYKYFILILIVLSVVFGVIPTLKSELESSVISEINNTLSENNEEIISSLDQALDTQLSGFSESLQDDEESDLNQRIAYGLFSGINLGKALICYGLLVLISYGTSILNRSLLTKITQTVFATLRSVGFRKSLVTDPSNLPSLPNVAGQYATAIQRGASNITGTYGYALEAGQHIFSLITVLLLVATKSVAFAISCLALVLGQILVSIFQARHLEKKRNELDSRRNDLGARTDDILSKREIILAYEQQDK